MGQQRKYSGCCRLFLLILLLKFGEDDRTGKEAQLFFKFLGCDTGQYVIGGIEITLEVVTTFLQTNFIFI